MIELLQQWDIALFQFINKTCANPIFDVIMPIITWKYTLGIPFFIIWLGLLIRGGKRGRIAAVLVLIAIAIADSTAAQLIKPWIARLRPSHALQDSIHLLVGKGGKFGFPSNHAANSFTIAVVMGYFYPRWKSWLYGTATLIALSRVSVGVHYPGDVLFGGIFGYGIAWAILSLWVIIKMRELKRGHRWVWYESSLPRDTQGGKKHSKNREN